MHPSIIFSKTNPVDPFSYGAGHIVPRPRSQRNISTDAMMQCSASIGPQYDSILSSCVPVLIILVQRPEAIWLLWASPVLPPLPVRPPILPLTPQSRKFKHVHRFRHAVSQRNQDEHPVSPLSTTYACASVCRATEPDKVYPQL